MGKKDKLVKPMKNNLKDVDFNIVPQEKEPFFHPYFAKQLTIKSAK